MYTHGLRDPSNIVIFFCFISLYVYISGVGRFAKLARTVTRSRSVLVQVAQHLPNMKQEQTKQAQISQISHVSTTIPLDIISDIMGE